MSGVCMCAHIVCVCVCVCVICMCTVYVLFNNHRELNPCLFCSFCYFLGPT